MVVLRVVGCCGSGRRRGRLAVLCQAPRDEEGEGEPKGPSG